jgi:hypothetical protein
VFSAQPNTERRDGGRTTEGISYSPWFESGHVLKLKMMVPTFHYLVSVSFILCKHLEWMKSLPGGVTQTLLYKIQTYDYLFIGIPQFFIDHRNTQRTSTEFSKSRYGLCCPKHSSKPHFPW